MILDFYRLREQPFGATPNPRYLFLSRTHREALASLYWGVESGCGFMAMVAKPGMGKTTLIFRLLEQLRGSARTVFVFQTQCDSRDLLRYILGDLGMDHRERDIVAMHAQLNEILFREARAGRRVVLVIDEAQNLDDSVLETVRLLSDFETPNKKLLQIILAGQPELGDKLARPHLSQLRQRISLFAQLEPFRLADTTGYIEHRLKIVGYQGSPLFTAAALEIIAAESLGIPRCINNICFNALSLGCALGRKRIDPDIIREVTADLSVEALLAEPGERIHPIDLPEQSEPPETSRIWTEKEEQKPVEPTPSLSTPEPLVAKTVPAAASSPESSRVWAEREVHEPVEPTPSLPSSEPWVARSVPAAASSAGRKMNVTGAFGIPRFGVQAYAHNSGKTGPVVRGRPGSGTVRSLYSTVGLAALFVLLVVYGLYTLGWLGISSAGQTSPDQVKAESDPVHPTVFAPDRVTAPAVTKDSKQESERGRPSSLPVTHMVRPNETLSGISQRLLGRYDGDILEKIRELNQQIRDPNYIEAGQQILLPQSSRTPKDGQTIAETKETSR